MKYNYFQLYNECYLIVGSKSRATIYNLLKRQVILLNEEETKIAISFENGERIDPDNQFIMNLEQAGFGFYSEKKFFVDKIRTKNIFTQNMFYKERPRILSATIHLTNKCNLNCEACEKKFCPSCIKYAYDEEPTFKEAKSVIDNLIPFGLQELVLVGGEVSLKVLEYCNIKGINTIINTNGMQYIQNLYNSKVIINVYKKEQISSIESNYKQDNDIIVVLHDLHNANFFSNDTWTVYEKNSAKPEVTIANMRKVGVQEFNIANFYNLCLSNRIYIMNNMDIVTCLGKTNKLGNLKDDNISDIIGSISEHEWKETKVKDSKCKSCEFRYSCNPCVLITCDGEFIN